MDQWIARQLQWWQEWRSKRLGFLGQFFLKLGITANLMTFFSLLLGLAAVYVLFLNQTYFIILAALHLLADGLDGIIARGSQPTSFGKYLDYGVDNVMPLLLLLKIGIHFNDYFAFIVAGLYVIAHLLYIFSGFRAPILFTRTITLILLMFQLPTITYLTTGIAAAYSLARQLQWYMTRR